jgi:hypothetical protein
MRHIFLSIPSGTFIWPDGKDTKAMVQQTAKEATAIMQLMATNASEVMS